jgi:hypothetical protein
MEGKDVICEWGLMIREKGKTCAREPAQAVERLSRTDLWRDIQRKGDGNRFPPFARRGGQREGTRLKLSQRIKFPGITPPSLGASGFSSKSGHENFGHESFQRGGSGVLSGARFDRLHVARIQRISHLQQQVHHIGRHPHLHQGWL